MRDKVTNKQKKSKAKSLALNNQFRIRFPYPSLLLCTDEQ